MKITKAFYLTFLVLAVLVGLIFFFAASCPGQPTPTRAPSPTPTPVPVIFAWNANPVADRITSYRIYEQVGAAYNLIATVPATVLTYTLPAPASGNHIYVLTALNSRSESPKSNQALWPVSAHAPSGFTTR